MACYAGSIGWGAMLPMLRIGRLYMPGAYSPSGYIGLHRPAAYGLLRRHWWTGAWPWSRWLRHLGQGVGLRPPRWPGWLAYGQGASPLCFANHQVTGSTRQPSFYLGEGSVATPLSQWCEGCSSGRKGVTAILRDNQQGDGWFLVRRHFVPYHQPSSRPSVYFLHSSQ